MALSLSVKSNLSYGVHRTAGGYGGTLSNWVTSRMSRETELFEGSTEKEADAAGRLPFWAIQFLSTPDMPGVYRLLDGVHRWKAYKATVASEVEAVVRLEMKQKRVHNHLVKMAALPKLLNSDLSQGFIVSQVAQKHGWQDLMVWALELDGKDDQKSAS